MTDHTNEPTIVQLGTRAARRRPSMHPSRPGAAGRSTTAAELPRLLAIAEVADHLGVTVRHVRSLVAERRIPFLKWGHLLRFDADEVCAWLERARIHVHGDDPASIGAFATRPDLRTVRGRR